jgi:hypothetical protein
MDHQNRGLVNLTTIKSAKSHIFENPKHVIDEAILSGHPMAFNLESVVNTYFFKSFESIFWQIHNLFPCSSEQSINIIKRVNWLQN